MAAVGAVDAAPFDIGADIHSESVLLSVISPDASSGVLTRLCRYPSARVAWVWAHVHTPAGSWTYVDDRLTCGPEALALDAPDLVYTAEPAADARWLRRGSRERPAGAEAALHLESFADIGGSPATLGIDAVDLAVSLRFTPRYDSGGTLAGRSELLGDGDAHVVAAGAEHRFTGVAQWHEQEQSAARFRVPFTYASLAGDGIALIVLIGPRASGGFVRGTSSDARINRASIAEPRGDGHHAIDVEVDGGAGLAGDLRVVHAYSLPLYGRTWRGTFVAGRLGDHEVSGFVNRWAPDAPPYPYGRTP